MAYEKTIDAGAPETEISPEMIEAGADIIWTYFYDAAPRGSEIGRETAIAVYQAMENLRRRALRRRTGFQRMLLDASNDHDTI
jgi:hypothetical protein